MVKKKKIVKKEVKEVEEKKGFCRGLKYWQKGLYLGLGAGFLIHIYLYLIFDGIYRGFTNYFHYIIVFLLGSSSYMSQQKIGLVSFLVIVLWYGVLGSLFGLFYEFIMKKTSKKIFLVSLWILFVMIVMIFIAIINYYVGVLSVSVYA